MNKLGGESYSSHPALNNRGNKPQNQLTNDTFCGCNTQENFYHGARFSMDPTEEVPLLWELESMGSWVCQYNFSRI